MSEGFRINKAYAEKYNTWRQKEELQKLKNKYGDEDNSEDSSSSESEDEIAEALTDKVEKDWLKTLSALKSKDPRIYQKDFKFFKDEDSKSSEDDQNKPRKSRDKPMFLKDYERKVILEKGGVVSDEDAESEEDAPPPSLAYHQEQEQLRKSIIAAAKSGDDSDESESETRGLLKKREKTAEEREKEEFEYLEWLKGQKESLEEEKEIGQELEPLKKYWQSKELDEGEKFLRNYILNRQYIDKDDESMPTYDEIVQDDEDFSEEEELLTKQENFERKYNFRFEEPDAAEVKTFPRNIEDTVRRKDTRRAEKRKEVEDRKKKEKEKKKEELKQLKKLKRQEIMDKIEKLKEISGNKKLGFEDIDLEEDFDPDKHDQIMQKYFDEEYYGEGADEEVKPVFEMSDEEIENWDNWMGEGSGKEDNYGEEDQYEEGADNYDNWNQGPSAEDPDFIMDADYDPVADMERKMKKKEKKKKNKLAQALSTKKPVFDPTEKSFGEYFDEYYKLDYEDIIGDMPCRFKYRKVTPNSYGLTVDEILKCRDKELNAWVSVKKMSQYRTEEEEDRDVKVFSAKGRNERKKKNVLTSLYESEEKEDEKQTNVGETSTDSSSKKKKKKKGKKKQKDGIPMGTNPVNSDFDSHKNTNNKEEHNVHDTSSELRDFSNSSFKKSGKHRRTNSETDEKETAVEQVAKKKRKVDEVSVDSNLATDASQERQQERKKKKHKHKDLEQSSESETVSCTRNSGESLMQRTEVKRKVDSDVNLDEQTNRLISDSGRTDGETERLNRNKDFDTTKQKMEEKNNEQRKKKKKKKNKNKGQKLQLSDERLKAYGINPKKYKYMKKEELFQIKPRNKDKKQKPEARH